MLQVIQEILKNPKDTTEVHLVFCNKCEDDILLKSKLDQLALKHANFHVTYVLSHPYILPPAPRYVSGPRGQINSEIVSKHLPPPSADTMILVCGPPGFMATVSGDKTPDYKQGPVSGILKELHYTEDMVYKF
jgi:cytochrome-b5 reductase